MGSANAYFLFLNFLTFTAFSTATFCCGYPSYGYPSYGYSSYYPSYPTQYVRVPIYAIVRGGSHPSSYATSYGSQDQYALPEMTPSYRNSRPSDEILAGYAAPPKYTLDHNAGNADGEESFRSLPSSPEEEASGMFTSSRSSTSENLPTNSGDTSNSRPYEFQTPDDNKNSWRRLRIF
ncbi:hypothetical protein QR680_001357 [Steinernema hermaphroditum]|uniref:Uncharacterized protein n=1 Tax=Steinernema hermaphroditum TaxID=289476 RepID=A0AA39LFA0_9BILA|nr:hypothetical protein QR680_001357 [Steinernema hermaphroditum]